MSAPRSASTRFTQACNPEATRSAPSLLTILASTTCPATYGNGVGIGRQSILQQLNMTRLVPSVASQKHFVVVLGRLLPPARPWRLVTLPWNRQRCLTTSASE